MKLPGWLDFGKREEETVDAPRGAAAAPAAAQEKAGTVSWAPRIDDEACRGCSSCLDECPTGVFAMGRHDLNARVARPNDCICGCERCAAACPERGISFPGRSD